MENESDNNRFFYRSPRTPSFNNFNQGDLEKPLLYPKSMGSDNGKTKMTPVGRFSTLPIETQTNITNEAIQQLTSEPVEDVVNRMMCVTNNTLRTEFAKTLIKYNHKDAAINEIRRIWSQDESPESKEESITNFAQTLLEYKQTDKANEIMRSVTSEQHK